MSYAMPPTLETGRDLLWRNAELATRLGALGSRGTAAAAALAGAGTPPPDDFVQELEAACRDFAAFRAEVLAAAGAAGIETLAADTMGSTSQIEGMLRALLEGLEAAERRAAVARLRAEALAVLDRVGRLVHRDDPALAALVVCQKRAGEIRASLAASSQSDPEREHAAAAEATAPFVAVLTLMDGAQGVDDDQWAALEDTVADAFGRSLAAAAARGRLRER